MIQSLLKSGCKLRATRSSFLQWFWTATNWNGSTGPLARILACPALLTLLARYAHFKLTCSLSCSQGKVWYLMSQFQGVLNHSVLAHSHRTAPLSHSLAPPFFFALVRSAALTRLLFFLQITQQCSRFFSQFAHLDFICLHFVRDFFFHLFIFFIILYYVHTFFHTHEAFQSKEKFFIQARKETNMNACKHWKWNQHRILTPYAWKRHPNRSKGAKSLDGLPPVFICHRSKNIPKLRISHTLTFLFARKWVSVSHRQLGNKAVIKVSINQYKYH